MIRETTETERQKALQTVSDMIEEIWGGLVLLVEDEGQDADARMGALRGLLRIAQDGRSEVEVALGNATKG